MRQADRTLKQSEASRAAEGDTDDPSQPALLLLFSGAQPLWSIIPIGEQELVLGREQLTPHVQDGRISRRHTKVCIRNNQLLAMDLGSLNGTTIDGQPAPPEVYQPVERCLRIGDTIFLVKRSGARPGLSGPVEHGGRVVGPHRLRVYQAIARFADASSNLHITGESGVGKEDAARTFHRTSAKGSGPFIAVNCATIPESIAERLLFGARRGAFSGANADADGYIQAADGGTLFLDEVAELHSAVQAKLLRVLENREVQALGAVKARPVDLRVCSASHMPLRDQVAAGRLREDLYYRIGRPEISIPPVREQLEEIPWLIQCELSKMAGAPRLHFSFIEACLLRHWPGNIRELLVEVRTAVQEARGESSQRLEARHLSAEAGKNIRPQIAEPDRTTPRDREPSPVPEPVQSSSASSAPRHPQRSGLGGEDAVKRQQMEEVLRRTGGNVSRSARAMGIHRTAFRRLMARYGIAAKSLDEIITPDGEGNS